MLIKIWHPLFFTNPDCWVGNLSSAHPFIVDIIICHNKFILYLFSLFYLFILSRENFIFLIFFIIGISQSLVRWNQF